MERKVRILDRYGNEIADEDAIVPDGGRISVSAIFMDARAGKAVPPPGKYFLYDRAGCVAGLGDVALATKAQQAKEDYKQRLSDASKKLPVARDVAAWQWYSAWLVAHGHL